MEKLPISNFTLDRCTACRAIWLDSNELQRVLAFGQKEADAIDSKGARGVKRDIHASAETLCPRDGSRLVDMVHHTQSHVNLLSCTVCGGILLDAGELTDLTHLTLAERLRSFFST